jgi:urea transport system ATP-binding protein
MNVHTSVPTTGKAASDQPMLVAENVDLYYGAAQALWDVSLTARAGEVTALLGRNGVGKTSFLRAVVGEQPIARGTISLNGVTLGKMAPHDRARLGIGYVPQGRDIFPLLTVKENLETGFAPLARNDRTIPPDVFDLFPVLADMLKRRGGDLSGGQQQQLAIGRALVTQPKVLLLDEPTEGIQPSIIKDIAKALNEIRKLREITIVVSEQVLSFALDVADRLMVIEGGNLVHESPRASTDAAAIRQFLSV